MYDWILCPPKIVYNICLKIFFLWLFLWLEWCGPSLMWKGKKRNLDQLIPQKAYWTAYWFPPPLSPLTLLSIHPSLFPSNRMPMSPLPTDLPPATVSQGSLRPSSPARQKISPEAKGNKAYFVTPSAGERKLTVTRYEWNQICLTCPAAMTILHADIECQAWMNGMQSQCIWQMYRAVSI